MIRVKEKINQTFEGGVYEVEVFLAPRVHPPLNVPPHQLLLPTPLPLLLFPLPLQPCVPGASQLVAVLNRQPPPPVSLQHHHLLKWCGVLMIMLIVYFDLNKYIFWEYGCLHTFIQIKTKNQLIKL